LHALCAVVTKVQRYVTTEDCDFFFFTVFIQILIRPLRDDRSGEEKPTGTAASRSRTSKWRESQEERRRQQVQTKLQVLLFRHKELLKKDMIKKRALLEKELQIEIQVRRMKH
jgi:hypothetical protein